MIIVQMEHANFNEYSKVDTKILKDNTVFQGTIDYLGIVV